MLKVQILDKCEHCQGQAYLPDGEGEDYKGASTPASLLAQTVKAAAIKRDG